jgi:hypothetical protein
MDGSLRGEGRLLLGLVQQGCCSGAADGSFAGQRVATAESWVRPSPRRAALGGRPEEVVVDLSGDVEPPPVGRTPRTSLVGGGCGHGKGTYDSSL